MEDPDGPARRVPARAGLLALALFGACATYAGTRGGGPAGVSLAAQGTDDAARDAAQDDAPSSGIANDRPDIVLVMLDDVGTNDVFGSVDLPEMTELGKLLTNGVRLDGYYGQSYCSPARATLLTGKFAHRIGFGDQVGGKRELEAWSNFSVPMGHELLPETMKRLGYGTHGIGKWNIGHCNEAYMPWNRGFDSWLGYFTDGIGYVDHMADQTESYTIRGVSHNLYDMTSYDRDTRAVANGTALRGTYTTSLFNSRASAILDGEDSAAPLFLWLAHHGMHDNTGVLDVETCILPTGDDDDTTLFDIAKTLEPTRFKFACGLRAVDRGIGTIREALDNRPRDYVLAVISDNGGYACGAHCTGSNYPRRGQKFLEFEGGVKVPGLVYSPTLIPADRRGVTFAGLFHHVDWLATFMDAAGGHQTLLDPNYDSTSQWHYITGAEEGAARDTIIFAASADTAAVRSGDYKYLYRVVNSTNLPLEWNGTMATAYDACAGGQQLTFLFDVANDPNELVDLSADARFDATRDQLHAIWRHVYDTEFWTPSRQFGAPRTTAAAEAFDKNGGYVTHWGCPVINGGM